jgi:hypothetical protein
MPQSFDKNLKGTYLLLKNTSIKNKVAPRSNSLVVLPKNIEVEMTGGFTKDWYYIYVKYNNKIYAGYIHKLYLKRVITIETE